MARFGTRSSLRYCIRDEVAMSDEVVTIELSARLSHQTLQELRALRKEVGDVRSLALQTVDYTRRVERRMGELRDDLELMIKSEVGAALAHMQTQIENYIQPLQDRFLQLDKLAERVDALERHL
jgi:Mg2+ and Co2+ transporter CorA